MTPVTIDADAIISRYQQEAANNLHRAIMAEALAAAAQKRVTELEAAADTEGGREGDGR